MKKFGCFIVVLSLAGAAWADTYPGYQTGASQFESEVFSLPATGEDLSLLLSYDSKRNEDGIQGHEWTNSLLLHLDSADPLDQLNEDIEFQYDNSVLKFDVSTQGVWVAEHYATPTLTLASAVFTVEYEDGTRYRFHDFSETNREAGIAGKVYQILDPHDNTVSFTYDQVGNLSTATDADGNSLAVGYNDKIERISYYNSTTQITANLIGQVGFEYYSNTNSNGGLTGDLQRVEIATKAPGDDPGELSLVKNHYFRYWNGTYNSTTNPGTDHDLKYWVNPLAYEAMLSGQSSNYYLTVSDGNVATVATSAIEFYSDGRLREDNEITYTWGINGTLPSDYNTWAVHVVLDRTDDAQMTYDFNKAGKMLTHVVVDNVSSPNATWIWHYDFTSHNRVEYIYFPEAVSGYNSSTKAVTINSSTGYVRNYEYFGAGSYLDQVKALWKQEGSSGTPVKTAEFARTISERPDLVTSLTRYTSDGNLTTDFTYSFNDGAKRQLDTTVVEGASLEGIGSTLRLMLPGNDGVPFPTPPVKPKWGIWVDDRGCEWFVMVLPHFPFPVILVTPADPSCKGPDEPAEVGEPNPPPPPTPWGTSKPGRR